MLKFFQFVFVVYLPLIGFAQYAFSEEEKQLPKILITGSKVANTTPAATYSSPISALQYEPLVDVQERGTPEAQGDVTIRGGIFENTGFRVGAATLFDPQTGHYFAEIPISSFMLSAPEIYTGMKNSFYGFNSSVATVNYAWKKIDSDIIARVGGGTHDFNVQHGYFAEQDVLKTEMGSLNVDLDLARSELGGTRPDGEQDFERMSGRLQWETKNTQTDFFFGYQDKEFSWPNLYVLPELHNLVGSSNIESEALESSLVMLNHKHDLGGRDFFEVTGYYRRHRDDYEFDKFDPGLFNDFKHETEVWSLGFTGRQDLSAFDLNYSGQYVSDDIESTSLVFAPFQSRSYGKFSVMPEKRITMDETSNLIITTGVSYEDTDRGSETFTPVAGLAWEETHNEASKERYYIEYAKSSQVPGYTAIGSSSEGGLFRGNQDLHRERSHNVEAGYDFTEGNINGHFALFYRRDNDLVDWTFTRGVEPFASRTANHVDLDVYGAEAVVTANWQDVDLALGYTFLEKNEDYGIEDVDASFYALNFANHRATAAVIYRPFSFLELRVDNEVRFQEDNELRQSEDRAFFTSAQVAWLIDEDWELNFVADNLWKTNFEDVPGVPGRGRLLAFNLIYNLG